MAIKVVRVLRENRHEERKFIGTAFFVNKNTLITAKHVVEDYLTDDYKIYLTEMPNGGNVLVSNTQIELCPRDIAVIKTQREYNTISSVFYSEDLNIGVEINIQGFHDEDGEECSYESPVSGYLNAHHTFEIQDSRTNGLSGSPVIVDGKICGIAQAISPEKNITYIIPISEVCDKTIFGKKETFDIYNSKELKLVKALLKNISIKYLKKISYFYLPHNYMNKIGDSTDSILNKLVEIGRPRIDKDCVPIVSILEEIENKKHSDKLVDLIDKIKTEQFPEIVDFTCIQNEKISELSLLVNFIYQDGKKNFKLELWDYSNKESTRIFEEFPELNLDNPTDINKFLDAIYSYCEEVVLVYGSKVSIEIILPTEKLYQNIKTWQDSNGFSLIRKFKYFFRLQSRFKKPDDIWKTKWEELDIDNTSFELNDKIKSRFIEEKSYDGELVSDNYSVILKEEISNSNYLFEDIEKLGIPIVISSLSDECNIDEIKDFNFKECQESICSHMMLHHKTYMSDIFFMIDNPDKIPDEFKNLEENLLGY